MESFITQLNMAGRTYGSWLGVMVIATTLIGLVLLSVERLLRHRLSLRLRYGIVCFVFLQLIAVPVLLSVPMWGAWSGNHHAVQAGLMSSPSLPEAQGHPYEAGTNQLFFLSDLWHNAWPLMVMLSWCGGLLLITAMVLWHRCQAGRRLSQSSKGNGFLRDILAFSCEQLRLDIPVDLKVCKRSRKPWAMGLIQPVVVIPDKLGPSLGSRHVRAALLQQLARIKLGVPWSMAGIRFLRTVHFYNPIVWWAQRRFQLLAVERADQTVKTILGARMADYHLLMQEIRMLRSVAPGHASTGFGSLGSQLALAG